MRGQRLHQRLLVALRNVLVAAEVRGLGGRVVLAVAVLADVRVLILHHGAAGSLDHVHGGFAKATWRGWDAVV